MQARQVLLTVAGAAAGSAAAFGMIAASRRVSNPDARDVMSGLAMVAPFGVSWALQSAGLPVAAKAALLGLPALVGWRILDSRSPERTQLRALQQAEAERRVDVAREYFTALGLGPADGAAEVQVTIIEGSGSSYTPDEAGGGGGSIELTFATREGPSHAASDIVFHEYAHGVVRHLNPHIGSLGESGAIQESLADTFAAFIDDDDWTVGEEAGGALRSLEDPSSRPSGLPLVTVPDHRSELISPWLLLIDRGGVHVNAGVPNRAAFLIGSKLGRDAAAPLYIDAIRMLPRGAGFADLAAALEAAAVERHGARSREARVVRGAWAAVGY